MRKLAVKSHSQVSDVSGRQRREREGKAISWVWVSQVKKDGERRVKSFLRKRECERGERPLYLILPRMSLLPAPHRERCSVKAEKADRDWYSFLFTMKCHRSCWDWLTWRGKREEISKRYFWRRENASWREAEWERMKTFWLKESHPHPKWATISNPSPLSSLISEPSRSFSPFSSSLLLY